MSFWPTCRSSEERGIDRRSVVRGAATALAGSALASAIRLQSAAAKASLPKVTIAPNRVIRQVAGLRPFRPSGFVVRAESLGDSFPTMMIETSTYLDQQLSDFLLRGGVIRIETIADVTMVRQLGTPLVFNCTGLGAKDLFGDGELTPIKGQLTMLLPQPEITYAYLDGRKDLYMFPRDDCIVLGGSHQPGATSTVVDEAEGRRIFAGNQRIIAGMA